MIKKTKFKDLIVINKDKFKDNRGYFQEIYKENRIKRKFPFVVMSYSKKNVLRGLHIQRKKPQGKIVSVLKGQIYDVALDLRKNSSTFGKVFKCILSAKNSKSIFIPPGFAHGFITMDKENIVIYSCTKYRDKKSETTIIYNDKNVNIKWPSKKMIISSKDKKGITFNEYLNKYI